MPLTDVEPETAFYIAISAISFGKFIVSSIGYVSNFEHFITQYTMRSQVFSLLINTLSPVQVGKWVGGVRGIVGVLVGASKGSKGASSQTNRPLSLQSALGLDRV